MQQLVSTEWLESELGSPDLVVLDCTVFLRPGPDGFVSESGRESWAGEHIPGSRFADLDGDLADSRSPYRYALPAPEDFAAAMAALGVDDSSRVVVYDDNNSMWAARVWWMLRWIGFDRAALLDGGMAAWRAEGRPVTAAPTAFEPGSLSVRLRPEVVADKAEVLAAIGDGQTCLVDALTPAMYRGEINMYRRPGHIPGAVNTAATSLLDPDSGRLLPTDMLRQRFEQAPDERIITYCGGGIAASATAFVATLLGYENVAVYTASLQEWAEDPDAPLVTGA